MRWNRAHNFTGALSFHEAPSWPLPLGRQTRLAAHRRAVPGDERSAAGARVADAHPAMRSSAGFRVGSPTARGGTRSGGHAGLALHRDGNDGRHDRGERREVPERAGAEQVVARTPRGIFAAATVAAARCEGSCVTAPPESPSRTALAVGVSSSRSRPTRWGSSRPVSGPGAEGDEEAAGAARRGAAPPHRAIPRRRPPVDPVDSADLVFEMVRFRRRARRGGRDPETRRSASRPGTVRARRRRAVRGIKVAPRRIEPVTVVSPGRSHPEAV